NFCFASLIRREGGVEGRAERGTKKGRPSAAPSSCVDAHYLIDESCEVPRNLVSQPWTSLHQSRWFCGLSTQCPSSGKGTRRLATPCRCSAVNMERSSVYGTRKSSSPPVTSMGVLKFFT